jgi:hypothetical protein
MTFEEYQKSKGRNYSSEADYKEYQEFMKQQGGAQAPQAQAPSPQGLQKAAATKKLQASTPPIKGAPLVDGSGQQSGVADASGNVQKMQSKAQSVLDAYKKNPVAKQELMSTENIDRSTPNTPPAGDSGGSGFTGDSKDIMAAASMGMQTVNAKNTGQALMGGAATGMQVANMFKDNENAAAIGAAVGGGTALIGMLKSRSERKKAERAQKRAEEKLKRQQEQARELQLMQSHSQERQSAFSNLMANL